MEIIKSKKGFEFLTNWVVILFITILIVSFFVSLLVRNIFVSYTAIIIVGVVLGRFVFTATEGNRFPYYVLGFGFVTGWLLGYKVGNLFILLLVYITAFYGSFKIHQLTR